MFSSMSYEIVGIGFVIRDMGPGDLDCHVILLDTVRRQTGNLAGAGLEEVTYTKPDGTEEKTRVLNKPSIRCMWLAESAGNRVTAPTLAKGAKVVVYKQKFTNKYFWTQLGTKAHTTKKEIAIWIFNSFKQAPGLDELSNSDPEKDIKTTLDYWNSSYIFQVDTVRQYVGLRTSNKAGEAASFNFEFDCKYGNFQLIDNHGTGYEILSKLGRTRIRSTAASCFRTDGQVFELVKNIYNSVIYGSYMSMIGGAYVQNVKGKAAYKYKEYHIETGKIEAIVDGEIKYNVKGNFLYHTEGNIDFITNTGNITLYTAGNINISGISGINIFAPKFTVNGAVNALALNLGGEPGEMPEMTLEPIERTKWEILDKVEKAVINANKVRKEKDEKSEKKEEEEKPEDIKQPEKKDPEKPEPDAIAKLDGKLDFSVQKGYKFESQAGRFDVEAKMGLSLKGGPQGEDLLKVIGGIVAEVAKLCQNLLMPTAVIGVTPLGGPLVVGCVPMAAQSIASLTQLLVKLNLIAGASSSFSLSERRMVNSYIDTVNTMINELEAKGFKVKPRKKSRMRLEKENHLNLDIKEIKC